MMSLFNQICLLLLLLAAASDAIVEFTHSTVYDNYDFLGVKEVPLAQCVNGCLIYASTKTDYTDEYMNNLVVHDYNTGRNFSIAMLSQKIETGWTRKLPLELDTAGRRSILNLNVDDSKASDLAVYVVDRATANSIDYEIYDAATMDRNHAAPRHVLTIMGAGKFLASARPQLTNSFSARLAGFDNARENGTDGCVHAYKGPLEDFDFHVDGPLISFMFNKTKPVPLTASYDWQNSRDLTKLGFITSPGFHGCAKVNPLQVYRQWIGGFDGQQQFDLKSNNGTMNVLFDIDADVTQEIVLNDVTNSKISYVIGVQKDLIITMEDTKFVTLSSNGAAPPSGFIARHMEEH